MRITAWSSDLEVVEIVRALLKELEAYLARVVVAILVGALGWMFISWYCTHVLAHALVESMKATAPKIASRTVANTSAH